jgi:hypothetical protein
MRIIMAFIRDLYCYHDINIEGFHIRNELESDWISVYIAGRYLPEFAKVKNSKVEDKIFIEFLGNIYGIVDNRWVPLFEV